MAGRPAFVLVVVRLVVVRLQLGGGRLDCADNEASAVQSVSRPADPDREAARPEDARPRPHLGLLQRGGDGCRRQSGAAGWLGSAGRRPGPRDGYSPLQPPPTQTTA